MATGNGVAKDKVIERRAAFTSARWRAPAFLGRQIAIGCVPACRL